ncbi:hypothetical protein GGF42_007554 [Coemansia sp. RSA 2424]|nr:hypothetical protein GGF42_007554 [Coemansia sp. RSA 2424]
MTTAGSTSALDSLNFLRRPMLGAGGSGSSSATLSGSLSSAIGASSSSILYGASTEERIVLDIGTHSLRAGFSGDHVPIHSSALNTAYTLTNTSITRASGKSSFMAYSETEEELEARLVEQLRDVYRRDLLVDARTRKVALVESALAPVGLRLAAARVLLGNLRVPHLSFYPSSVAALMTCGSVNAGLVIDCGHRVVSVTPVYEARALPPYATLTPLAGSALFSNLRALLESFARFTPSSAASGGSGSSEEGMECRGADVLSDSVVAHIMTRLLLASPIAPPSKLRGDLGVVGRNRCELSQELVAFYESSSTCSAPFTRLTMDSPGYGRGLLVFPSWIRERAAEPLFCGDPAADYLGIPDAIVQCIERVPVDIRRALVSRILVIGGVADMPGFRHRLLHDIVERLRRDVRWPALAADAALADDSSTSSSSQAFAPSDRSWIGASLAVAAKIGTVELSREDFDGKTLPDWTSIPA